MPKVTLELPEQLYRELEEEAKVRKASVEEVILEKLSGVWVGGELKDYARKGEKLEEILRLEEEAAEEGFVSG